MIWRHRRTQDSTTATSETVPAKPKSPKSDDHRCRLSNRCTMTTGHRPDSFHQLTHSKIVTSFLKFALNGSLVCYTVNLQCHLFKTADPSPIDRQTARLTKHRRKNLNSIRLRWNHHGNFQLRDGLICERLGNTRTQCS